jgi:ATP-dependent RNA helicase DDX35
MYPVEVTYLQDPLVDYVQKAAEVAWNIHLQVCPSIFLIDSLYLTYK